MLRSLQGELHLVLALLALEAQRDLLGRLGLHRDIEAVDSARREPRGAERTFLWKTGFV